MPTVIGPDGNHVEYQVEGDGSDLLLIHGITENRNSWGSLRQGLARSHRVISVDLRGHGASEPGPSYSLDRLAADVHAVAEQEGCPPAVVIGHSLGGAVASVYAAAYPTRAVVNVDQPLALAAFQDQLQQVEPLLRGEAFGQVMTGLFDQLMGPLDRTERDRLTALRRPDQSVVLGVWDPIFSLSADELDAVVREMLAGIEVPYLSLHGEDPGPEYRVWLGGVIPQAEVEVWPGSGHYPHLMDPDRFLARVTRFVG